MPMHDGVKRLMVLVVLAVAAGVLGFPSPAAGQARGQAGQRDGAGVAELQRLFDAYLVREAQSALHLDDEQFRRVLPRIRQLQAARRRHEQARQRIVSALSRLSAREAGGDAAIADRLRALQEHDDRASAELRRAYDDLDGELDVRRRARFRVFEQTMERRKLQLMLRARRDDAGRQGPGRHP